MKLFLLVVVLAFISSIWAQDTCPRCTPLCKNGDGSDKTCGDNGCGGSCGTCGFGQGCCGGICVCLPSCSGRQCGDDGCGGNSCGTCSSSQSCSNGVCVGTATPDCGNRQCGNNRAGGSCGNCPTGQRCRGGVCECYYDCNDRNCGTAPQEAGTNTGLCPQRSCGTCPSGYSCSSSGRCQILSPCTVTVTVVDCSNQRAISSASSVLITSTTLSYSSTITVSAGGSTTWTTPGLGSFSFQTTASGYLTNTQSFTLTATTTSIQLCVNPALVQIDVRDAFSNVSITVGTSITWTGVCSGSLRWNGVTTMTHCGFGNYAFTATPDSRYSVGTLNFAISSTTTLIIIYVQPLPIPIRVVDCASNAPIQAQASVRITTSSVSSYSSTLTVNSGASASWSFIGYYSYSFSTSATGYVSNTQSFSVSTSTSSITVCVSSALVQLDVRDAFSNVSINVAATVSWTGVGSGSLRWTGVTTFTHNGFGNYAFTATPDSRYSVGTLNYAITSSTTLIIIYVQPLPIPVRVVDCTNNNAISSTASITVTTSSVNSYRATLSVTSGGSASWSFVGYYSYSFATSASGYVSSTSSVSVTTSTSSVTVCLNPATVRIDVRNNVTDISIEVGATVQYSGVISGSFRWNGITTFTHGGFGSYTFLATPDSKYTTGSLTTSISASTTLIIIYVGIADVCGDGKCSSAETASNCPADCVAIFFEYENADGSGPVNQPTVNYFLSAPLDANQNTGPNRNSVQATTTRTTGNGSNTVLEETYGYDKTVWIETIATGFINFYWRANVSLVDPGLGVFRLRVHLSALLTSNNLNYRFVNTWRPIDAEPAPYAPTDLNLHSFHPNGALDVNNPNLTVSGFLIGRSVADSKQSGGPATMDISPSSGTMIAIWNSKPPRSNVIAPSQNSRYIVNSGSYVVFYGKTSNAASGKQLGQVVMDDIFLTNPNQKNDRSSDLWYVAQFTVRSPAVDQPTVVGQSKFKKGTVDSQQNLIFDCEAYSYCRSFVVPFSDTGRRDVEVESF